MSVRLSVVVAVSCLALVACNNGAGNNLVVRLEAEVAGARCANGGVAVQIGFDKNSNQVLDDDEVSAEQTKYVCNGAAGPAGAVGAAGEPGDAGTTGLNALSVVTAEAAGTNCQYGGVRIDVGVDTDRDGALGTSEITSTRYVCDRASVDSVYFGDLTIRTAADLARLDGIKTLAGTLTIESLPGGVLTLPSLEVVANGIVFTSRDGGQGPVLDEVTSVSLPELTRAGGLNARFVGSLVSFSAPKLERLINLDLSYDDALTTLSLPALAYVDSVYLTQDPALITLSFPALRSARSFEIGNLSALTSITAPQLTEVTSYLGLANNAVLPVCAAYKILKGLTSDVGYYFGNDDETPTCTGADICATATVTGVSNPLARCVRPLGFAEAQSTCASLGTGASLAWVTSDAEWLALSAAVADGSFRGRGWLGYTDVAAEGTWVAVGGFTGYDPTARTDFWSPGEPSDGSMLENHLELFSSGLANDADGANSFPFVCRVP